MPEVGDGRPAGCKPAALVHPQFNSGSGSLSPLPVNRFPASGKGVPPPLRKAGAWFESRRKLRCFPLWQRPTQPAADARVESGVRRQRIATLSTLSTPSPRPPGWVDIRINVDTSGRGEPPTTHAHARGRKPPPQTAHDHGPRPGRPVGIHHSRPETLTCHATPYVSTFAGSRPDPTPLPPRRPQGGRRLPDPGALGLQPG